MSEPAVEQVPEAMAPVKWTAERRAEFFRKAEHLTKEGGKLMKAGEVATAEEARRPAVWFVKMEISTQVHIGDAAEAEWRDGPPGAWAFPLTLTFPDKGHVGRVGEVLVDAITGQIVDKEAARSRIDADVEELARRTAD